MLSAKQVEPGQSGQIEVNVKTEGASALSKSVNITTNDPKQPRVTLVVSAVVQPEFGLSEKSIYFGSVPKGKEVIKEITITLPLKKAVKILSANSTDQNVTVRLEPVPDAAGKQMKLIAVQKADAKDGYHFGAIILKTTSVLAPEVKIPVRGLITANQNK